MSSDMNVVQMEQMRDELLKAREGIEHAMQHGLKGPKEDAPKLGAFKR